MCGGLSGGGTERSKNRDSDSLFIFFNSVGKVREAFQTAAYTLFQLQSVPSSPLLCSGPSLLFSPPPVEFLVPCETASKSQLQSMSLVRKSVHRGNTAVAGVAPEPPTSEILRPAAGFRHPDPVDSSQGEGVPLLCELTGSHTDRWVFEKD